MTFRFLHLADLHLDSAYGGRPATRSRLRLATMEALERAASFAIRSELDAVLIAGDAFDEGRLGYDARAALRREVARLSRAGITVVYATGNHDPGGASFAAGRLRLGEVSTLGSSTLGSSSLGSSSLGPSAPGFGGDLSTAPVHVALAPTPVTWTIQRAGSPVATVTACGHDTTAVAANLAQTMRAPRALTLPHVAVLHTQVGSARGADGHERYAPSSGADLERAGFAYWALGHVHVRGRADRGAPAWYSGNLQGRNARESGPKGGLLVEVDASGLVRPPEFVAFAPVEFLDVTAAVKGPGGGTDGGRAAAEDLAAAVRSAMASAIDGRGIVPLPREAVLRVTLSGSGAHVFEPDLADPVRRASLEDAVRDDLQLSPGEGSAREMVLLEVELRSAQDAVAGDGDPGPAAVGDLVSLERELARAPSALREALRLAEALERDPAVADGWALDWSGAGGEAPAARRSRIARLARGLRDDLLRRAAAGGERA